MLARPEWRIVWTLRSTRFAAARRAAKPGHNRKQTKLGKGKERKKKKKRQTPRSEQGTGRPSIAYKRKEPKKEKEKKPQ
jgi:hypothetical protein